MHIIDIVIIYLLGHLMADANIYIKIFKIFKMLEAFKLKDCNMSSIRLQ